MSQIRIPVTESSQPAGARREAVRVSREAGLCEEAVADVALLVTELATNLFKHATGGELLMRPLERDGGEGIEVLSLDKGPGISDIARALGDGYSTTGSSGTGLGAVVRGASEFDIYSQPGRGTALVARVFAGRDRERCASAQAVGVVHQAKEGEDLCGDGWLVRGFTDGWLCAVADGLGHGPLASEAASSIVEAMREGRGYQTPVELVEAAHRAAKPTRGAAFGVAVKDPAGGVVRFAGIGNITAVVLSGGQRRHLVSHDGIIGQGYRKAAEVSCPWSKEDLLVLHSDGIATQWIIGQYPGLSARDPSLLAGVLYRDFSRGRDDATVVVVKER